MDKIKLRKEILLNRKYNKYDNNKIYNYLINTKEYKNSKDIFIYLSTVNEIDTFKIINNAIGLGKNIYVPKIIASGIMSATLYKEPLILNKYGIFEPQNNIYPSKIDLAIIPCLACDKYGHRIGYGLGYYDRFLMDFIGHKIILSAFLIDKIEINEFDVSADIIITKRGVLNANK